MKVWCFDKNRLARIRLFKLLSSKIANFSSTKIILCYFSLPRSFCSIFLVLRRSLFFRLTKTDNLSNQFNKTSLNFSQLVILKILWIYRFIFSKRFLQIKTKMIKLISIIFCSSKDFPAKITSSWRWRHPKVLWRCQQLYL